MRRNCVQVGPVHRGAEIDGAVAGGDVAEQEAAKLTVLLASQPDQVVVAGAARDHRQRLEHAVVEGTRHLLARPGGGDLPLGAAEQAGGPACSGSG